MLNDVNFSEEIEKIAEIFLPLAPKNFEEIYIKFELYTENGDCGTDTHTVCSGKFIPLEYDSLLIDELYEYFSAIRKKCIEKWYIAELKFYPDKTWNIEFVYGEIPEVEDDDCEDDWQ